MAEPEHLVAEQNRTHARRRYPLIASPDIARPLILISGKDALEGVGGHETYVRSHALAAARLGLEPHVFCVGSRPRTTTAEFGVVHYVRAPLPVALHGRPIASAVDGFVGRRPGRIGIHSFAIWAAAGVRASRALGHHGIEAIPVASAYGTRAYEVEAMQAGLDHDHGLARRARYRAWLHWIRAVDDRVEGRGYADSRVVLVNYASVERILQRAYGLETEVRRVPYASEAAFAMRSAPVGVANAAAPPGSGAPLVLAVSRHDPRKGLDVLLRALAEVAADGVPFCARLIGPGRLLATHRRLAAELGLSDRVEIPGPVEDVSPYLASADVFVLPSLAEASGSVSVLEALEAGTAVIASECDGIPEDLTDGSDALLVPPGDAGELALALRRLLTEPQRRDRLAAGGRRTYERRFSAAGFVESLGAVYAELGIL